jgi:hypothetical protein
LIGEAIGNPTRKIIRIDPAGASTRRSQPSCLSPPDAPYQQDRLKTMKLQDGNPDFVDKTPGPRPFEHQRS